MGETIVALLPVALGAIAVPIYAIISLILLQGEGGVKKALALVAGAVSVRLLQGVLLGMVFGKVAEDYPEDGPTLLVAILLFVLGIMLLIKGFRAWQKEVDPEDSLPKWMSSFEGVSTLKAAGIGALYVLVSPKQWVFTELGIGIIIEAALGQAASIGLYLFYVIATQITVLIPLAMMAIAPEQAAKPLKAAYDWLARHNNTIMMVVSFLFGLWFTYKGLMALLG